MRHTLGLGVLALVFAISGCGASQGGGEEKNPSGGVTIKKEGEPQSTWKKKSLTITMIAKSSTNPVFLSAKKGAEDMAAELSKKHGVEVKVDWRTPAQEDGQVQAQTIQQAANEGSDAILISCSDAGKVQGAINDAAGKGIAVMTFDSDASASKRFAFYGVDDEDTGKQVMSELAQLTGGKANVAILAGNQNAPNLQKRVQGVKDQASKYPGIKIIGTYYHPETPQDAASEVLKEMNANPEIDAWAMVGGWPLFTQALLDLSPEKVKIVAVDCLPAQLAYIEKGVAPVLLAQPTYQWGAESVKLIVEKLIEGKVVPDINKMELVRVSKENLGSWAKQLKDWGMDVEDKYLAK